MIGHQMPFLYLASFLLRQPAKYLSQILSQLTVQRLA
jgi:hypothetical protein